MLKLELGTVFFQLIMFGLLIFAVSRFALRPLLNTMNARTERIRTSLEEAEEKHKEALRYSKQQKEALQEARKEAQQLLASARVQKEKESALIIQEATQKAKQTLEAAREEIDRERAEVSRQLRAEVGGLAVQLASRILHKEIDRSQHERLLERYLKQVSS